jgi:sulfatase modifying factor 1
LADARRRWDDPAVRSPLVVLTLLLVSCGEASPPPVPPRVVTSATATVLAAPTATAAPTTAPEEPPPEPPSRWARCEAAPVGMVCIPGGSATIGDDTHRKNERPRHEVEVSTFYLDKTEVTNAAYEVCEKAGVCPKRILPDKTFLGASQPAVPVTWAGAEAYCRFVGKRLPTEAEWEKAARGATARTYPWGEEPATCDRAQTEGCAPNTTKDVASFAADPFGTFDLAGNGYEWVQDWASGCYEGCPDACGAACSGLDPMGPCGGAPECTIRGKKLDARILKGGSWRWDSGQARGAWRRPEDPRSGAHRLSLRCASSAPELSTWPPLALSQPAPDPGAPGKPTEAELAAFRGVVADTDIGKIPDCERPGGSTTICRDPFSYVTTNEPDIHLFGPWVKNLGGIYAGVGADQGLSFVANQKARWAYFFDYDPQVVALHRLLRALVLLSPTAAELVASLGEAKLGDTRQRLRASLPEAERAGVERTFVRLRQLLHADYQRRLKLTGERRDFDWLASPAHYTYVRSLYEQGRILPIEGNLLTDKLLPSIGKAARALGEPVRAFYTSNADDQWKLTEQFRANVRGLPMDGKSVLLRTVYPRDQQRSKVLPWDYVIQHGLDGQRRMAQPGWDRVEYFNRGALRPGPKNLVVVAMPASTPREPLPPATKAAPARPSETTR